ncbi:MAG: glycosyl hydrolase [Patescibacteria group bacterium]
MNFKRFIPLIALFVLVGAYIVFNLPASNQSTLKKITNKSTNSPVVLVGESWSIGEIKSDYEVSSELLPFRSSAWWKHPEINNCNTYVYPYPYVLELNSNKIGVGILSPLPSKDFVVGKKAGLINFTFNGEFTKCGVTSAQQLSADFNLKNDSTTVNIFAAKGLGYIYFDTNATTLSLEAAEISKLENFDNRVIATTNETTFGIEFNSSVNIEDKNKITSTNSDSLKFSVFLMPNGYTNDLFANVPQNKVDFISTFSQSEDSYMQEFKLSEAVPVYLMPHHYINKENPSEVFVSTLRGNMRLEVTDFFTAEIPNYLQQVPKQIKLTEQQKQTLATQLRKDIGTFEDLKNADGIYWKGKTLAKYVNLLYVANLVEDKTSYDLIFNEISTELDDWFLLSSLSDKKYFSYDNNLGGLVSSSEEFGHQEYNDHHFHYGYWVYTMGMLAELEPNYAKKYSTLVDYLIRDVASNDMYDPSFPYLRHFDLYEGHSYASGLVYFADGNNQESTSEAVNFWYGAHKWYNAMQMADKADWYSVAYNLEAFTSNVYYHNTYNLSDVFPPEYKHELASIVWEGKYDFATWFSADPNAIHGIQILPVTFGSYYLNNSEYAKRKITSLNNEALEKSWGDINLGYEIINGLAKEQDIENVVITDSGITKTWLYMLLYAKDIG